MTPFESRPTVTLQRSYCRLLLGVESSSIHSMLPLSNNPGTLVIRDCFFFAFDEPLLTCIPAPARRQMIALVPVPCPLSPETRNSKLAGDAVFVVLFLFLGPSSVAYTCA